MPILTLLLAAGFGFAALLVCQATFCVRLMRGRLYR